MIVMFGIVRSLQVCTLVRTPSSVRTALSCCQMPPAQIPKLKNHTRRSFARIEEGPRGAAAVQIGPHGRRTSSPAE